jgi:hypothetical protein
MRCRALLLRFTDSIGIKSQAQLAAADPIRHQRRDGDPPRLTMHLATVDWSDFKAELEQFAVDARCAPEHLPGNMATSCVVSRYRSPSAAQSSSR